MSSTRLATIAAAAMLAAGGLAACGGDDDETAAPTTGAVSTGETPSAQTDTGGDEASAGAIDIAADPGGRLAYDKDELSAGAGEVTVKFSNDSSVPHDFVVEKDGEDVGKTEVITDGEDTLTVELEAGEYAFYCSVPGHRQAGMEGKLTVE